MRIIQGPLQLHRVAKSYTYSSWDIAVILKAKILWLNNEKINTKRNWDWALVNTLWTMGLKKTFWNLVHYCTLKHHSITSQVWLNRVPPLSHLTTSWVFPLKAFTPRVCCTPPWWAMISIGFINRSYLRNGPCRNQDPISRDWHWRGFKQQQLARNILPHDICEKHLTS